MCHWQVFKAAVVAATNCLSVRRGLFNTSFPSADKFVKLPLNPGELLEMSNVYRLRNTDRIFFITTNLERGIAPLAHAEFKSLLQIIEQSWVRLGFGLCGYVLMPDHWHALIWPRHPLTISRVLQDIKYVSSRKLNQVRETTGSVWQHQVADRFVRSAQELRQRLEYMHNNPIRKGLVHHPQEWRWSSYNNFALEPETVMDCPIQIDYVQLPDKYRA